MLGGSFNFTSSVELDRSACLANLLASDAMETSHSVKIAGEMAGHRFFLTAEPSDLPRFQSSAHLEFRRFEPRDPIKEKGSGTSD